MKFYTQRSVYTFIGRQSVDGRRHIGLTENTAVVEMLHVKDVSFAAAENSLLWREENLH